MGSDSHSSDVGAGNHPKYTAMHNLANYFSNDFLGVTTCGNLPKEYQEVISDRRCASETKARRVFDSFAEKLSIQSTAFPSNSTPRYVPYSDDFVKRGVYFNANDDLKNPRGAGQAYYHELAHMIDHASMDFQSLLSKRQDFYDALITDGRKALKDYEKLTSEQKKYWLNKMRENDRTHSVQDLLEGTTNGVIQIKFGHISPEHPNYWKRDGALQAEAFAHFFEASMGAPDKLQYLQHFFPTAYYIFQSMIDDIAPDIKTLEKKLIKHNR